MQFSSHYDFTVVNYDRKMLTRLATDNTLPTLAESYRVDSSKCLKKVFIFCERERERERESERAKQSGKHSLTMASCCRRHRRRRRCCCCCRCRRGWTSACRGRARCCSSDRETFQDNLTDNVRVSATAIE